MIIIQLTGGLGNQMFQYALGRAVSLNNSCPLKFDITEYSKYPDRDYALSAFKINESFASADEICRLKFGHKFGKLLRVSDFIKRASSKLFGRILLQSHQCFKEKSSRFDPTVFAIQKDAYLEGYWQTEQYFSNISELIKKDFCFRNEPSEVNKKYLEQIKSSQSVSIHVRRGDYVSDPCFSKLYVSCSIEYYKKAIDIIKQKIDSPVFFVFSDDPDWAEANLKFGNTVTIRGNVGSASYEDLRLMSCCRHNIIANSSFSWWGAWLCTYPGQIVIAPKNWFVDNDMNSQLELPERWIRI